MPDDRASHLTPPPQKRIKSVDLYRAQRGLSPEQDSSLKDVQPLLAAAAAYRGDRSRDRNRSKDHSQSRDSSSQGRDHSSDLRDSLLGQALEAGTTLSVASVQFSFSFFFLFCSCCCFLFLYFILTQFVLLKMSFKNNNDQSIKVSIKSNLKIKITLYKWTRLSKVITTGICQFIEKASGFGVIASTEYRWRFKQQRSLSGFRCWRPGRRFEWFNGSTALISEFLRTTRHTRLVTGPSGMHGADSFGKLNITELFYTTMFILLCMNL